jgi:hypothetical protein
MATGLAAVAIGVGLFALPLAQRFAASLMQRGQSHVPLGQIGTKPVYLREIVLGFRVEEA